MKYSLNSRLYSYNHLINKYDFLDKEFLTSSSFTPNLSLIKTLSSGNLLSNLVHTELSTFQKVSISKNKKLHFNKFVTTLRGLFVYTYLEFLLYTSFKVSGFKPIKKCFFLNNKTEFSSFIHRKLFFSSSSPFTLQNLFIILSQQDSNYIIRLNSYFLPD